MIMYFYYGISHSTLEQADVDVLELEIGDHRKHTESNLEEKAVWDQSQSEPEPIWSKPIAADRKQSLCK